MLVNISLDAPIFGGFLWLIFMVDLVLPILPSRKLIYPTWRKAENHFFAGASDGFARTYSSESCCRKSWTQKCLGSKGYVSSRKM